MSTPIILAPDQSRFPAERITEQMLLGGGQLLLAAAVAIVWEYIATVCGWTEDRQYPLAPAGPQILNAIIIAVLGFFSAWSIVGLLRRAAGAGRWVWLPPTALLFLLIGRDILGNGMDWQLISAHYFWDYPTQKNVPLERDILTYPTLSAIAYSIGVRVRILQRGKGVEG